MLPLPAELHDSAFTRAEADRAGATRAGMRRSGAVRVFHGVYAQGLDLGDLAERCRALLPVMRSEHWFSHATAARLWGMPLPVRAASDEPLHVLAVGSRRSPRRGGVVGWQTADVELPREVLGLLPVVSPVAVWSQLAVTGSIGPGRALSREQLVAVGDSLVTPQRRPWRAALCTVDDLARVAADRAGQRGAASLEWALRRVRAGAESPKETELRLGLVASGLPEPEVQVGVMTADGLRHADLGYRRARLLLEYQGDEHRTSRSRWLADLTRRQLFEDAGYRVIDVGAHDLEAGCRALAERVRRALAGTAWAPPGT